MADTQVVSVDDDGNLVVTETKPVVVATYSWSDIDNKIASLQAEIDNFNTATQNRLTYLNDQLAYFNGLKATLEGTVV